MARTIKVLGWGTGQSPATIIAQLDGETVFSGQVDLVEMSASNESAHTAPTLFSFEVSTDFSGTKKMKISVSGAPVRFAHIVGNYTAYDTGFGIINSGAGQFLDISTPDADGVRDPRTNVAINGIKQSVDRNKGKGVWHWVIKPGSTFEHDLYISLAGLE